VTDLRIASSIHPVTLDQLDPIRRRQLEIANGLYGGEEESIAVIFGRDEDEEVDERIMPSLTELRSIVDLDGRPVYDAWLYMGDSGTVFVAGTEQVVAEVIQCGIETKDAELKASLRDVLAWKPAPELMLEA